MERRGFLKSLGFAVAAPLLVKEIGSEAVKVTLPPAVEVTPPDTVSASRSVAIRPASGFMSAADKTKLDVLVQGLSWIEPVERIKDLPRKVEHGTRCAVLSCDEIYIADYKEQGWLKLSGSEVK